MASNPIRLYVIGDSISIHYGPYLEKFLSQKFIYDRKGKSVDPGDLDYVSNVNGGDSRNVLQYLQSTKPVFDTLLLNCGLHDIKTINSCKQVPPEDYRCNLQNIIQTVHKMNRHVVWLNSTPVNNERHNSLCTSFKRYNEDILYYNEIAASVMTEHHVPIIDLYEFTAKLGEDIYCDHIHFTKPVRQLQAAYIAGCLDTMMSIT